MTTASVRQIRGDIRAARLRKRTKQARKQRNDTIYLTLLGLAIYGGILVQAIRRMLDSPPIGPTPPSLPPAQWLVVGCAVLGLGLLIRGLLVFGPIVAGSPFQFWLLSTPLDRKALLGRRFWWTAVITTVVGALLGLALSALLRADLTGKLLSTVIGAALAATILATSVLLQAKANDGRRWSTILAALGVLTVGAAAALPVPVIDLPVATAVIAVVPLVVTIQAYRALSGLDRAALASGTEILTVTRAAVTWLDVSMFTGISATRKWRRIGKVTYRPLRSTHYRAMFAAELTRLSRSRNAIVVWATLLLGPYAAARVLPDLFIPIVDLVLCTIAVSPFAAGLRQVGRSPALRRSLGGSDAKIRLAHLVVPAALALVWTVLSVPAAGFTPAVLIVPIGAAGFAYRRATQPPLDYSGTAVDTPFGLMQPDMFRQLSRGPLLLLVLAALQLNL